MISIIIATYNAAKTLHNALQSVLHQSYQDWECIVVDGASTDKTLDIIKYFVEKDSRFCYISESDKGIYDAFNKGWKMANGDWIYYLGADDVLLENAMSTIFGSKFPIVDIIYGNVVYKTPKGLLYKKSKTDLNHLRRHMICSHQAVIMKKVVLQEMNGFNQNFLVSADFDLMLRCFLNGKTFKYLDVYISIFDNTGTSNGISAINDAYTLRKNNHSISNIENGYIYAIALIKFLLKRIKYIIK